MYPTIYYFQILAFFFNLNVDQGGQDVCLSQEKTTSCNVISGITSSLRFMLYSALSPDKIRNRPNNLRSQVNTRFVKRGIKFEKFDAKFS